jgi:hypothetical protein
MTASVVAFPFRRARARRRAVEPARPEVIRFPGRTAELTERDLDALCALACSASGGWVCEAERDRDGALSAVFISGRHPGGDYVTYVVCRCDRKLLLIEAQPAADWLMLGSFDGAEALVPDLERVMG